MVRVTEISLRQNKEQEAFIENITKWNNTQNPVKVPDFRSNDLVQRDLHKRFAEISLGSRPLDYRNKRGAKDPKSVVPISMEEFAKTIHSFKWGPPDMWGGTAALFSLGKDGRYAHVFGDGVEPHNAYSDSEFRRVAGIWLVCTRVQEVWRQERETRMAAAEPVQETAQDQSRRLDMRPIVKAALERRWMVYAVVGVLLRERYRGQEDKLDEALERFSKPSHWIETDTAGRKAVDRLTKKACILLIQSYKSASQSPKFVQRNWNRSKDTIESIVEEVRTTFDPEDLPFLGAGK
jgi:hypothetical protein